jgi:hypothetical protein
LFSRKRYSKTHMILNTYFNLDLESPSNARKKDIIPHSFFIPTLIPTTHYDIFVRLWIVRYDLVLSPYRMRHGKNLSTAGVT